MVVDDKPVVDIGSTLVVAVAVPCGPATVAIVTVAVVTVVTDSDDDLQLNNPIISANIRTHTAAISLSLHTHTHSLSASLLLYRSSKVLRFSSYFI